MGDLATPNLALPYIAAAQAQKHVTHNAALNRLDALTQIAVADRQLSVPPQSPAEGGRHIVGPGASGLWSGRENSIAAFQDGAWTFLAPKPGWLAWVADESGFLVWDAGQWRDYMSDAINPAAMIGINTGADATNRLSIKSDGVLHSHDDITPGNGSVRHVLNKNSGTDTASFLFQTNWSGRAEFGLTGNDDWNVKVSPDGVNWTQALVADRTSGEIAVRGLKSIPANFARASSLVFTPGGDGEVSIYRINANSSQNPRAVMISSISGDLITLSAPVADTIYTSYMNGVSLARIWNTTLSADSDSAWVMAFVGSTQLRVSDAAHIANWGAGQTIQIGDPESVSPGRSITLDISPMLTALFGQPFPQSGILLKSGVASTKASDRISVSPTGAPGSFVTAGAASASTGVTLIPCTELSPVSASNLVRVCETIATTAGVRLLSSVAITV